MSKLDQFKQGFTALKNRLFQKNKFQKEIRDYLDLAATRPNDMRIRIRIAEIYFKAKEIDKSVETYLQIADTYVEQDFTLKAVACYKNVLMIDPSRVDVNLKLVDLYIKLGMNADAVGQMKIAIRHYKNLDLKDDVIALTKRIVELIPSSPNRRRLGELYQSHGLFDEAITQYEVIATEYRQSKSYDELLKIYELILPHKPDQHSLIRDVCILYLRKQEPDMAIKTMERYKVDSEAEFTELYDKAKLMKKTLRSNKTTGKSHSASAAAR